MNEFVLFDVEYTTWEGCDKKGYDHAKDQYREIIQIGAVVVDSESLDAMETFLVYCKPLKNPILSDYCIKKTGITQDKIDKAQLFSDVIVKFAEWVGDRKSLFWGNDFAAIRENCELIQQGCPFDTNNAFNLKTLLKNEGFSATEYQSSALPALYGIIPVGKPHDSLADTYNVLAVLQQMKEKGEFPGLMAMLAQ